MLPKFHADMSCRTSFNPVYFRRAMITCHARRCLIVYLFKGDDGMPRPMLSDHVLLSKGDDGMPYPILSDCVLLSKGDDGIPRPM